MRNYTSSQAYFIKNKTQGNPGPLVRDIIVGRLAGNPRGDPHTCRRDE